MSFLIPFYAVCFLLIVLASDNPLTIPAFPLIAWLVISLLIKIIKKLFFEQEDTPSTPSTPYYYQSFDSPPAVTGDYFLPKQSCIDTAYCKHENSASCPYCARRREFFVASKYDESGKHYYHYGRSFRCEEYSPNSSLYDD